MRRLNVREAQIDACIRNGMFALYQRPRNPELFQGELLLLQLTVVDASRQRARDKRINFALVFDRIEPDPTGEISRHYWPGEDRVWPWIVYASATVPTVPFSLEELDLSRSYDGQTNAFLIRDQDENKVAPYIQWSLAQAAVRYDLSEQVIEPRRLVEEFGRDRALEAIFNHDRVEILTATQREKELVARFVRKDGLADALKSYYDHRCQICEKNFVPRYGERVAESHHIQYLRDGGFDVSGNMVVLCPDHHRVVHATHAQFDRQELRFTYPNGLQEKLALSGHLVETPLRQRTFDLIDGGAKYEY